MTTSIQAWILEEQTRPGVKIWGLSGTERLRRALCAAGVARERINVGSPAEAGDHGADVLLFRADHAFDERLVRAVVDAQDHLVLTAPPQPVAARVSLTALPEALALLSRQSALHTGTRSSKAFRFVTPLDLVPAYTASLRKADPPYVLPIRPDAVRDIESRIFAASYKGITDLVTKWVWPAPARAVTRRLADAGVRPNAVTALSWLLALLTVWLFLRGHFASGLLAGWFMTFLDTVDGKLARVTLTSSPVGHVLDHGLDLLHPPFWYLAWAVGLPDELFLLDISAGELEWSAPLSGLSWFDIAALVIVAGYIVGRLIEGLFLLLFKIEIHCWRPIDSFFRAITARRNPNMLLLTAGTLAGRPDYGFLLVAAWTVCCLAFHMARLAQAAVHRLRGQVIYEWQGNPPPSLLTYEAAPRNAPRQLGNPS